MEEKLVIELLRRLSICSAGIPRKQRPPEPDIHFEIEAGRSIGVEVTTLEVSDTDAHRIEREIDSIIQSAKSLYYREGHPARGVTFYSNLRPGNALAYSKVTRGLAAQTLVKALAGISLQPGEAKKVSVEECPALSEFFLSWVFLQAGEFFKDTWVRGGSSLNTMATIAEIQSSIDSKNLRVAGYRKRYAETWLLIHSGFGGSPTNTGRYPPARLSNDFEFKSAFTKTYFMSAMEEVSLLKTSA